ncbi:MAG: hypothetical protein IT260_12930 [Saprospiraceae bacterium]|nr:hypothetical protein [Saprospiraceae bacterium]
MKISLLLLLLLSLFHPVAMPGQEPRVRVRESSVRSVLLGKAKVSKQCQTRKEGEHSTWTSEAWQFVDKQGNFKK